MSRHDSDDLKVILTLAFIGGGMILNGYRRFRLRRLVEDLPTSPIESAPQGLVELQGRACALSGAVVTSVDRGQALVNEIEVQRYISGKNGGRWETEMSGVLGGRFVMKDSTGYAHVLIEDADFNLNEVTWSWDALGPDLQLHFQKEIEPYLTSEGFSLFGRTLGVGEWRILERTITPGEDIYVIGTFQTRQSEPEISVIDPQGQVVRVTAAGGVMKRSPHPLIIADCKQTELLERLGNWNLFKMIIGAALIAFAAFLCLVQYFNARY